MSLGFVVLLTETPSPPSINQRRAPSTTPNRSSNTSSSGYLWVITEPCSGWEKRPSGERIQEKFSLNADPLSVWESIIGLTKTPMKEEGTEGLLVMRGARIITVSSKNDSKSSRGQLWNCLRNAPRAVMWIQAR